MSSYSYSPSSLPQPASSSWNPSPSSLVYSPSDPAEEHFTAWARNVVERIKPCPQKATEELTGIQARLQNICKRDNQRVREIDQTIQDKTLSRANVRSRSPRSRRKLKQPAHSNDKLHTEVGFTWYPATNLPVMKEKFSKVVSCWSSSSYPALQWPSKDVNQWVSAAHPPSDVFYHEHPSSSSSARFPFWDEGTEEEERNVSVAMPSMMEVPPMITDLPLQASLAFNWIIRLAPWELCAESIQPFPLLPPQREEHRFRKTLVLDLDETLVHCNVKLNDPGAPPPEIIVQIKMSPKNTIPASVYLRPHCQELLQKAAGLFEVVVFTASVEPYATAVVDLLDKNRIWVSHVLCRDSCTELNGQLLKDMRRLGRKLEDIVLVDNSPLACGISPENSIVCKAYYGQDHEDRELLHLRSLLHKLQKVNSLPEYLDHRYGFTRFVKQQRQELIDTGQL